MPETSQPQLRQRLREERRALDDATRHAAAQAVDARLAALGLPRPRSRLAAYLPTDGELDTAAVITRALALGCEVHVPVITSFRQRRMALAPFVAGAPLLRNRWGLLEPQAAPANDARWMDLVLLPCVGFDGEGNRLGMGAGFYDRHLAFLRHRQFWRQPTLIGLAYAFQRVDSLPAQAWDVPLDGVITEQDSHLRPALSGRRNKGV